MPGRWDSQKVSSTNVLGNAFPGSKEAKAWENGFSYRYTDTAANAPITDNPFDATQSPVENRAWDDGWDAADANTAGKQYGPATTGAPQA
jgi:hypothetical protein